MNVGWGWDEASTMAPKPKKLRRPNLTLVAHPAVKAEEEWSSNMAFPDLGEDE